MQGIRSVSEKDHQGLDGDKNILVQNVNQNGKVVGVGGVDDDILSLTTIY